MLGWRRGRDLFAGDYLGRPLADISGSGCLFEVYFK
jgi:hypothetical protein